MNDYTFSSHTELLCIVYVVVSNTFTFEALSEQPIQQGSTMITKSRAQVVVDFESVWHVNVEPLFQILQKKRRSWQLKRAT